MSSIRLLKIKFVWMKRNRKEVAADLVDKLWENFMHRVPYARSYNDMVHSRSGSILLDHIGFRTLNTHTGEQPGGIWAIRHIFECLGYVPVRKYTFPRKKLKATHFESSTEGMPKIFVSQLEVSLLPQWVQQLFPEVLSGTAYLLSDTGISLLNKLNNDGLLTSEAADILVGELVQYFRRPWNPPLKDTILKINDVSHYAAWVLLHGNAPSHFASLVNEQNVTVWPDLTATCQALKHAGIPMKEKIEGTREALLQQSATYAVKEEVTVKEDGIFMEIPWTYAYLELIQRSHQNNDHSVLFQDFLEDHERHLYQMTMTLEN